MENLSIRTKLISSFIVILALINILGGYALYSMANMLEKVNNVAVDCVEGIIQAQEMAELTENARRLELSAVLQNTSDGIAKEEQARAADNDQMNKSIKKYMDAMATVYYMSEEERLQDLNTMTDVKTKWEAYQKISQKALELNRQGKKEEAKLIIYGESATAFDELKQSTKNFTDYIKQASDDGAKGCQNIYDNNKIISIIIQLIALILTIVLCYILYSTIKKPIDELANTSKEIGEGNLSISAKIFRNDELGSLSKQYNQMIEQMKNLIIQLQSTAEHIAASSEELTANSEQSSNTTQDVAQNVNTVSAQVVSQVDAIDSMDTMINDVAKEIQSANALADKSAETSNLAAQKTQDGTKLITQAINQMKHIEEASNRTTEVVTTLGERSSEIGQIVETIAAISSQTNLLALNAAIEAARAGEQGKGFAVVAEEVRKLAEQSQEATEKIAGLINTVQTETNSAVETMQLSGQEVQKGAAIVNESGTAFGELAKMSYTIGTYAHEISDKMEDVLKKTNSLINSAKELQHSSNTIQGEMQSSAAASEEQAASIEEIASSSNNLAHLAEDMQKLAHKFHL